jgi:hypothetical protein
MTSADDDAETAAIEAIYKLYEECRDTRRYQNTDYSPGPQVLASIATMCRPTDVVFSDWFSADDESGQVFLVTGDRLINVTYRDIPQDPRWPGDRDRNPIVTTTIRPLEPTLSLVWAHDGYVKKVTLEAKTIQLVFDNWSIALPLESMDVGRAEYIADLRKIFNI